MTESGNPSSTEPAAARGGAAASRRGGKTLAPAVQRTAGDPSVRGKTSIADGVVEKIAALAARDVMGVHALGVGAPRGFGVMRERVPGGKSGLTRGVKAEVGEVQTALDLDIVVEYGVSIADVARDVRENVIAAVERMTGLEVVEVNIAVGDVKLPDEDGGEESEQRIQ